MNKPHTLSLYDFAEQFSDEASAVEYFEQRRWVGGVACPHCGSLGVSSIPSKKPMPYRCRDCRKHFSVRTGTVLAESKLPLHKWLMAIYMLHTARKGVSSVQMAKELGITQKSAWFLNHRIREAMRGRSSLLDGEVEVDETYVGGKERNRHASKKEHRGRGTVGKQAVIGLHQRDGETKAFPVDDTDRMQLQSAIASNVRRGTHLYTDSHAAYFGLTKYNHSSVAHSAGEYVRGKAHTNGIESFWALMKRGYIGIYHYMSFNHLHRYTNEFTHRHTLRTTDTIACMASTIDGMLGRRLSYKELIS